MINLLNKDYLVVVGAREKRNRFSEDILHFLFKKIFYISDPLSGFKGYNLSKLKRKSIAISFQSIGTKTLIKAIKNKLKICSFNIDNKKRSGDSRYGSGIILEIKILWTVLSEFF